VSVIDEDGYNGHGGRVVTDPPWAGHDKHWQASNTDTRALGGPVGVENHLSYRELTYFPGITTPTTTIKFPDAL
jgi:hypothetical protein